MMTPSASLGPNWHTRRLFRLGTALVARFHWTKYSMYHWADRIDDKDGVSVRSRSLSKAVTEAVLAVLRFCFPMLG